MKPGPMTPSERDWFDERVESYVDGDLGDDDRQRFEAYAEACGDCDDLLRRATRVQQQLKALPIHACPASVVAAAEEAALSEPVRRSRVDRRAVGLTVALAASVAAVAFLRPDPPSPTPQRPTNVVAQTRVAPTDVRRAVDVLRTTAETRVSAIGEDTLRRAVVQPAQKVLVAVRDSKLGRLSVSAASLWATPTVVPSEPAETAPSVDRRDS